MIKQSNELVEKYSLNKVSNYYYKVLLRDNIEEKNSIYTYNEYELVIAAKDNADEYIDENFDILLNQAKVNEENKILREKINTLKKQLDNSDYKVLKCTESFMLGSVLPYDFSKLLSDRMGIRDNINALQDDSLEVDALEKLKERKIAEMSAASQTTITNGIDYNEKHYRLNTTDQINLTSLYSLAQSGASVPYHADGEVCRVFTPEEMCGLVQNATKWVIYHTTYFNLLKHQILALETEDEVKAVYYGIELKDEYKSVLKSITEG